MNRAEISESRTYFGHQVMFNLVTEHGILAAALYSRNGRFEIVDVTVESGFRHNGLGQALLLRAREIAIDNNATIIHSKPDSREAVEAFQQVFGDEAVIVRQLGSYTPDGEADHHDAVADLSFSIPQSIPRRSA